MGRNVQAASSGVFPTELLYVSQLFVNPLKFSLMAVIFDSTPPVALSSVAVPPIQTVDADGVTVTAVGNCRTDTFTVPTVEQPLNGPPETSVAVTVYVVVVTGFTPTSVPARLPGFHKYEYPVLALETDKRLVPPTQMTDGFATGAVMGGAGVTVAVTSVRGEAQATEYWKL